MKSNATIRCLLRRRSSRSKACETCNLHGESHVQVACRLRISTRGTSQSLAYFVAVTMLRTSTHSDGPQCPGLRLRRWATLAATGRDVGSTSVGVPRRRSLPARHRRRARRLPTEPLSDSRQYESGGGDSRGKPDSATKPARPCRSIVDSRRMRDGTMIAIQRSGRVARASVGTMRPRSRSRERAARIARHDDGRYSFTCGPAPSATCAVRPRPVATSIHRSGLDQRPGQPVDNVGMTLSTGRAGVSDRRATVPR